ncbi:MAG: porin family protein [Chlorobium sp.]|nr:MAG: porin family protein [Chlorobium sp.]
MKKVLVTSMLITVLGSASAFANTYVSASAGIGLPNKWQETGYTTDVDTNLAINGAIGYDFGSTRMEASAGYQKHDHTNTSEDFSVLSFMANGYYDFHGMSNVTPYLMAGAGIGSFNVSWDTRNASSFIWQVGAGMGIKIDKNLSFDFGYRYLKPEGLVCPTDGNKITWSSNNFLVGLRYGF